eukprot:UN23733
MSVRNESSFILRLSLKCFTFSLGGILGNIFGFFWLLSGFLRFLGFEFFHLSFFDCPFLRSLWWTYPFYAGIRDWVKKTSIMWYSITISNRFAFTWVGLRFTCSFFITIC